MFLFFEKLGGYVDSTKDIDQTSVNDTLSVVPRFHTLQQLFDTLIFQFQIGKFL